MAGRMKPRRAAEVAFETLLLADDLRARLCERGYPAVEAADVFACCWPLAVRLVRLRRRARRDARADRERCRLLAKAGALLEARPDGPVPAFVLARTVEFAPDAWHAALLPGPDVAARNEVA
jgi:hypothetical protein